MSTPSIASPARVMKNTAAQLLTFGLSGVSKSFAAILVARSLGPEGLGLFTLAWTLCGTIAIFAVLGLDFRLIRELARTRSPRELESGLPLACLLSAAFAAVTVAVPVVSGARGTVVGVLAAAALYILLTGPVVMLRAWFHANERMELETATLAVEGAVGLTGVIVALWAGAGVTGAVLALGLARCTNLALAIALARRSWGTISPRWEPGCWLTHLRRSFPVAISYGFTSMYLRFDVLVLAALRPARDVALYSAASIVILTVPIIATSVNGSLYPVLSRSEGVTDPALLAVFHRLARLLILGGVITAAVLTALAGPAIALLYGPRFGGAVRPLLWMSWVLPLRFLNNLLGVVLTATDRHGRRTLAVGTAAMANIGANVLLIPSFGFMGSVYATLGTEVLLTGVLLWGLRPLRPRVARTLVDAALAGLIGALAAQGAPGNVLARSAIGLVAAVIVAAGLTIVIPPSTEASP